MKTCSVEGCENKGVAEGLCKKHWQQLYKYGKILDRTIKDPNKFILEGEICKIQLYDNKCNPTCQVIVDCEDYDMVKNYKWRVINSDQVVNNKVGYLSRFLMMVNNTELQVDHINHDRLDNRRENLRICFNSENCLNKRKYKKNKSGYKGVCRENSTGKWRSEISFNGVTHYLGTYKTKREAAIRYNREAKKLHGEFACLNVIKDTPEDEPKPPKKGNGEFKEEYIVAN